MNAMPSSLLSHFKLLRFYKGIFRANDLFRQSLDIAIRGRTRFPATVNMLITNKCNFSCRMCSWQRQKDIPGNGELSLGEIQGFISRISVRRPVVHIGGGEPFMRPDLLEIIRCIKKEGLRCLITTNGQLLDESLIGELLRLRIDALIFSLYGWGAGHDIITGAKGAFPQAVKNIRDILKRKTKSTRVFISTLPMPENITGLRELIKESYALGVDGVKIEQLNFLTSEEYGRCLGLKEDHSACPSTFVRPGYFDKSFISAMAQEYKDIARIYNDFVLIKPHLTNGQLSGWYSGVPGRYQRCFFVSHSVFINYNGDMIPCQFFPDYSFGNIRNKPLDDAWGSAPYEKFRAYLNKGTTPVCERCCKN